MKKRWLMWTLLLLLPMLACMEPCEDKTVTCSRAVVNQLGYCPGVRIARDDGFQCSRGAGSLQEAEWSCQRCP